MEDSILQERIWELRFELNILKNLLPLMDYENRQKATVEMKQKMYLLQLFEDALKSHQTTA